MNDLLISQLTEQFLEAERNVVDQVLTMHLGRTPGKVEEFLIEKIHPFKNVPDYALHFDGYLLGYVKFEMQLAEPSITFVPAVLDEQINAIEIKVKEGFISEKESERRIDTLIDSWFNSDNDK